MFKFIKRAFIIYMMCINLLGMILVLWSDKSNSSKTENYTTSFVNKKDEQGDSNIKILSNQNSSFFFVENEISKKQSVIDEKLLLCISAIGGSLGVYSTVWIFRSDIQNFYIKWGSLAIILYNTALSLFLLTMFRN